ncbi:pimeloyl-CoA dehydrogenase small subunit [Mycolicibacterium sp. P9-64]|uniref:acyl-CoA dehydrogenase family protein n=1 Tax=Mycolicibacterium sp. P9-64 TaxID=2024612 RepID=UPI0011ECA42D|nr:acyl-CoA dehydrogenase family protein [Mycolicibacterium sp. P9-64]KAA0078923.1 pimeloyl-CoA dehydrogenase small subunit [Mycolicibacterium sp. P9-64]
MDFSFSHEQELLRDGLIKFLATRYDLEVSRAAVKTGIGWQPEIWRALADELGILGAGLPEDVGGIGGGPVEVMIIAEALGHALVVEPYVDTAVVAAGLLRRAGGDVATALLENIVAGHAIVALAAAEAESGDRWQDVSTTARRDGADWILDGAKIMAVGAPIATHLLVTARTDGGISLFCVEVGTPGIELHGYRTIDDRRAADLVLTGLRLPADALLGEEGQAWPSLDQARDEGAAAVCAEAVGGMRKVLADTVEYCKQRQQFGQPIGSFQALQHRMVDMHMELEQSVAAVYLAMLNLEAESAVRARAVSAAKATIGRAARFIGQNAVQLHGGMGMTEELAIGHYFKRLTAVQYEFGSTDHHVTRYAELTRA